MSTHEIMDTLTDALVDSIRTLLASIAESAHLPSANIREWYSSQDLGRNLVIVDTEQIMPMTSAQPGYGRVQADVIVGILSHFDADTPREDHRAITGALVEMVDTGDLYAELAANAPEGWAIAQINAGELGQATSEMDDYRRRNMTLHILMDMS